MAGFPTQLRSEATTFAGEPRDDAAEKLLAELFPDDITTIIHASYENELSMVDEMVNVLNGGLAGAVTTLGLEHFVQRIGSLADQFREALGREKVR